MSERCQWKDKGTIPKTKKAEAAAAEAAAIAAKAAEKTEKARVKRMKKKEMEKEAKEALKREREAKKLSDDSIALRQQSPSSESEADSPIQQGIEARRQRVRLEELLLLN